MGVGMLGSEPGRVPEGLARHFWRTAIGQYDAAFQPRPCKVWLDFQRCIAGQHRIAHSPLHAEDDRTASQYGRITRFQPECAVE